MRKSARGTAQAGRAEAADQAAPGGAEAVTSAHPRRIRGIRAAPGGEGAGQERPDYSVYRMSRGEYARELLLYCVLDLCVSYLFFYSGIAFLALLPGAWLFLAERKRALQRRCAREMRRQFLDGIQMLAASLQAGYSVENALREALGELRKMYPTDAFIVREFHFMDAQIGMSRSMEELFLDFGRRCGIEDIQSFAEVFLTAKRSGGDLLAIIRNTASCIRQKQETMEEIETCLSGKMMEQNIMSLIPLLILAYVKLTSPEFLSSMYGSAVGTTVMGICFAVYVLAYFWGKRIVSIEV